LRYAMQPVRCPGKEPILNEGLRVLFLGHPVYQCMMTDSERALLDECLSPMYTA